MERDMLLRRIENEKLIRDDSSDNDVNICIIVSVEIFIIFIVTY